MSIKRIYLRPRGVSRFLLAAHLYYPQEKLYTPLTVQRHTTAGRWMLPRPLTSWILKGEKKKNCKKLLSGTAYSFNHQRESGKALNVFPDKRSRTHIPSTNSLSVNIFFIAAFILIIELHNKFISESYGEWERAHFPTECIIMHSRYTFVPIDIQLYSMETRWSVDTPGPHKQWPYGLKLVPNVNEIERGRG